MRGATRSAHGHAINEVLLAIAREGSFTKTAESLHMTQPLLSRQMRELEQELGVQLFDRSGKGISLTDEGLILRERAQEVVDLVDRIRDDLSPDAAGIAGNVRIACGETDAVALLARAAKELQQRHSSVTFRLLSGDRDFVMEKIERDAADLGLLVVSSVESDKFDFLRLPVADAWGVLMQEDDPLCEKACIVRNDLAGLPLILPYRAAMGSDLMSWFGTGKDQLNVVATYDLAYNASRFAKEGFGYAVVLDGIVDANKGSGLAFRPLEPSLHADLFLVWRRERRLSKAAQSFLERIRKVASDLPHPD